MEENGERRSGTKWGLGKQQEEEKGKRKQMDNTKKSIKIADKDTRIEYY